ncbi:MAG: bifunctional 3,4-dihydroxy-2-butanone-4-phosphate synthase/GTP cyclohydrolase II, partial [Proteobacteria bacterium]|nr:bifunctional 3,4-dihydroxy-2-butanone-4-phosphate synthase/GTP cyclohydrolase II [Pseudomonadota bacterium]MBV1959237.1 bifunctional 3,4-dihydroxy-2-butanone-4-phosphate synthase/GTP cyclohydrolase II [Pseudomonadales bacterium]
TMRDLLHTVRSNAPKSWSMHSALEYIAQQENGVLVLIAHNETPSELLAHIEWLSSDTPRKHGLGQESHIVRTVGGGSQVLRDLGVQKMRLLSGEVKYNALSGFGLEVVDYIPRT